MRQTFASLHHCTPDPSDASDDTRTLKQIRPIFNASLYVVVVLSAIQCPVQQMQRRSQVGILQSLNHCPPHPATVLKFEIDNIDIFKI